MAELEGADEIARLLALLIRIQLGTQGATIDELAKLGFSTKRIADLLGTSSNTVNVSLQKSKKKAAAKS